MLFSIMADGTKHIWVIPSLTSLSDSYLLIYTEGTCVCCPAQILRYRHFLIEGIEHPDAFHGGLKMSNCTYYF